MKRPTVVFCAGCARFVLPSVLGFVPPSVFGLMLIVVFALVGSCKGLAEEFASKILLGHTGRVFAITFNHDGNWLASGGNGNNEIRIQGVMANGEIHTLVGHKGKINDLAFRMNGELVSGSDDGTVRLWNVPEARQIRQFNGGGGQITSVSVSPDDQLLVAGSSDKTLKLWEIDTGQLLTTFEGHEDLVWTVSFSPDGQTIASGSEDRTVRLWNVLDGTLSETFVGHTDRIWSVAFNPDGTQLASGSWDGMVRVWQTTSQIPAADQPGQPPNLGNFEIPGNPAAATLFAIYEREVLSVAYSPDGRLLAIGLSDARGASPHPSSDAPEDETVRLWDVSAHQELRAFDKKSRHDLAFSPNGLQFATAGASDGGIIMWEASVLKPSLLAPESDTHIQTPKVLFQWEAIPGTVYYDIEIALNSTFLPPLTDDSITSQSPQLMTQTDNERLFEIAKGVKKYWWRVRTGGFGTVSEWSDPRSVIIEPATECAVKILPPRRWVSVGEEFTVEIIIEDVVDLAGFQFNLHWTNPDALSFVTVTEFKTIFNTDTSSTPQLPNEDDRFFQIDQGNGFFRNVVAARFGEGGVSGSDILLKVLFKAKSVGNSGIELQELRLADSELQEIHCHILGAEIIVEEEARPWDINRDGSVNIFDLRIVANFFGQRITTNIGINPDINGDGIVDILDITLISSHFGDTYK